METTEYRNLMEEPPGGPNAGRAASPDPSTDGRHISLAVEDAQARGIMNDGGWTIVTHRGGEWGRSGGSDHRGVLRGDEHVDPGALRAAVEQQLGFTQEEIKSVYRQGRLSAGQGELRARIDARLLALSLSGGNMVELGRVLGLAVRSDGEHSDCETISNALARARAQEERQA